MKTLSYANLCWLAALTLLTACHPPRPRPPSKEEMQAEFVRCFREEMQPTDDQVKQLQERVFRTDAEMQKTAETMKKENEAFEGKLENPSVKDPELLEHYHRISDLRAKMGEDHFRRMLLLRSLLTDDQVRKFLECKRKMGPPPGPQD